ncbi:MAG: hypothetical protein FJY92_03525 [Candidatus Hydrogenedentes bacterium]|nr:hypothetical protein [Candidatus Hydrogenedentota bacterium]
MEPTDKFWHFWISYGIAYFKPVLAIVAGIGKEVYDAFSGGNPDVWDLVADGMGVFAAWIASPFF